MSDPDNTQLGYAAAADAYWQAGWRGILPLGHKKKWPPPSVKCEIGRRDRTHRPDQCSDCISYTGHTGVEPSWPDIIAWSERYTNGNLCLRLPYSVIGIDVDAYGAKTGAAAIAEAEKRWGPLPGGPRSSSRDDDPVSGIRLFRVPEDTVLEDRIVFPELGIGDIEMIQRHHRYVVAWPSIHPEGRSYWWRNESGQLIGIPTIDDLPWLPQPWLDALKVAPRNVLDPDAHFNVRDALTTGDMSIAVQERLSQAIKELNLPGQSRHDTCCRHVLALMRLGKSGNPGVTAALHLLCEVLVAARQVDKSDTPEGTRAEFDRMVNGDNAARELAQPTLTDWIGDLDPKDSDPGEGESPEVADVTPTQLDQSTRQKSPLEAIEQDFWESRECLAMVYNTALAMMASPWATLGVTAARALATVRPNVTLPPIISGPGSLNLFIALVAKSGGGKGAANGAASLLVPDHLVRDKNLGSGEGLVALFGRSADEDDPTPIHESLLINVDEVDILTAIGQRTGSTMMAVLRSAFMGETLGFSYADKSKRRDLRKHTYRMTMVVSIQPKRAGPLLADEGGGTPQRFMWFPAKDDRISMEERWPSGPLTLPEPSEWLYPREIVIPDEARYLIRSERVKSQHESEEENALDGHALFCREKFAYALAIMDGRTNMTSEDWELSEIVANVSTYTREKCAADLKEAARIDALDRGEIRGIEMHAADDAKEYESAEKIRRVLRGVLSKLDAAGEDGVADRDLKQRTAHRDRRWLVPALQIGVSNGLIRQLENTTTWVKI